MPQLQKRLKSLKPKPRYTLAYLRTILPEDKAIKLKRELDILDVQERRMNMAAREHEVHIDPDSLLKEDGLDVWRIPVSKRTAVNLGYEGGEIVDMEFESDGDPEELNFDDCS